MTRDVIAPKTNSQQSSIAHAKSDADSMISNIDYSISDKASLILKIHSLMSEIGHQMSTPLNFISEPSFDIALSKENLKTEPNNLESNPRDLNLGLSPIHHLLFFGFNLKIKYAKYHKFKKNLFK